MPKGHSGKPFHKTYAETGKLPSHPESDIAREFAKGGFVSTNDEAHRHRGAPMHYGKTTKMKTRGPG